MNASTLCFNIDLKYTKNHEWVQTLEGGRYRIGITPYAQKQLGSIIHIDPQSLHKFYTPGHSIASLQTKEKTVDICTPVKGKLLSLNQEVLNNPSLINEKAENSWICEMLCDYEPVELMSEKEYNEYLKETAV